MTVNIHHATAAHETAVAMYVRLSFSRILREIEPVTKASTIDPFSL